MSIEQTSIDFLRMEGAQQLWRAKWEKQVLQLKKQLKKNEKKGKKKTDEELQRALSFIFNDVAMYIWKIAGEYNYSWAVQLVDTFEDSLHFVSSHSKRNIYLYM